MKTGKHIHLDATRLYGFRIAAQPTEADQQNSKLGTKKVDSRLGSKIGSPKRY